LTGRAILIEADLNAGTDAATIYTNDLSHAYVEENSAYSS
jgi:glutamate N-acetyltransferase/amino-acid N-acetyltransferase